VDGPAAKFLRLAIILLNPQALKDVITPLTSDR
jgi:hypothetical protein